ncbi:hypothetical protein [Runella slithyformis]|uniref:Uncharacterized protein n=1 Tax=Runella slithyformis (strain ATCC 29530 / DSM 19594 / LMG 11500 / NCIMB 11436 / LSU 4) TaxID=761193 RepID=A0A7U3ZKF1_RUNSL|nr:hypothetical protein [Runella slithyformis]AEI48860.1 hypothetical protein Runsl_2455 [Runella slithyformis DSM 19594]
MKTLKTISAVIVVGLCAACTESNIQPQQSSATTTGTVQQVGFEKAPEQTVPTKPRMIQQP